MEWSYVPAYLDSLCFLEWRVSWPAQTEQKHEDMALLTTFQLNFYTLRWEHLLLWLSFEFMAKTLWKEVSCSLRKQSTFGDATTGFLAKWRLRNERRNSILMTRHYPDLGNASDRLNQISHVARPIRSTTQICVVTTCCVCIQDQSFNTFENETMKLSDNGAKLNGLWARNCNRFWFQNMPSDPKSYRAFRETGPRGLKAGSLENDIRTLQPFEEGWLLQLLFQTLQLNTIWPTLSKSLQISTFPFAEALWRGVNFHKSATFTTSAPCWNSITRR